VSQPVLPALEILTFGLRSGGPGSVALGAYGYSWDLALRAFLPVLERIAPVRVLARPESQLDYRVREARQRGGVPVVLAFRPFQDAFFIRGAPILSYCFWEYPDVPAEALHDNPRYDWRRMAGEVSLILCGSSATADAFRRAGVTTPLHVVPPPLPPRWWGRPGQREPLTLAGHELAAPGGRDGGGPRFSPFGHPGGPLWRRALRWVTRKAAPAARLLAPPIVYDLARRTRDRLRRSRRQSGLAAAAPCSLPEGHVVFTFVFNPCDGRKAWREALTAFVHALGDRDDAALVLKFACPPRNAAEHLPEVQSLYESLAWRHPRCRALVIDRHLPDDEMGQLIAGTTWYLNGSRAEGCCLPLLEAMAAGRPALSPAHTAMRDYFSEKAGLVLGSEEEPTHWPGDDPRRLTTTWHRLSWPSLCRGLREAYDIARSRPADYAQLADGARAAARDWASEDVVEGRLRHALAAACRASGATNREVA